MGKRLYAVDYGGQPLLDFSKALVPTLISIFLITWQTKKINPPSPLEEQPQSLVPWFYIVSILACLFLQAFVPIFRILPTFDTHNNLIGFFVFSNQSPQKDIRTVSQRP